MKLISLLGRLFLVISFVLTKDMAFCVETYDEVVELLSREVSGDEVRDLRVVRGRVPRTTPEASSSELSRSSELVDDALARLALFGDMSVVEQQQYLREIANVTRIVACGAHRSSKMRRLLVTLVDEINDSRLLYRVSPYPHSAYQQLREVPRNLMFALGRVEGARRERLREGVKALVEFDYILRSREDMRGGVNSDYLLLVTPHLINLALSCEVEEDAVREMRVISRFLSVATQYADGGDDILKRDGVGFHHNSHYNGYMYSFNTWTRSLWWLRGESFRVEREGYERLKQGLVSLFLMATCSDNGQHITANSLAGRHPFTGMSIPVDEDTFLELIEIGADLNGGVIDLELASYYNYFFKSSKYKEASMVEDELFYQFNYSPIGVYRGDGWVATMRSPTTRSWGAEIYDSSNRFGRYQSHGTLEVIYEGGRAESGYLEYSRRQGGRKSGWDWNMPPGSTTVHYVDWAEMMPNGTVKDRFDQYAATSNFAGALAWGRMGLFGAYFDQDDRWGARCFEPTNLQYYKSVFAIDGVLISLGSGISSWGDYCDEMITATNLFQAVGMSVERGLIVDGERIEYGSSDLRLEAKERAIWIFTPQSTGYVIPSGGDPVVISSREQSAPSHDGSDIDDLKPSPAVKGYIDHGLKPQGSGYEFVVVPDATPEQLAKLSEQIGGLYKTLARDRSLHALYHYDSNTYAYAVFEPQSNLEYGYLRATASEMLIMERYDFSSERLSIALCNPNLRPESTSARRWVATPTHTSITLSGEWNLLEPMQGLSLAHNDGQTTLEFTLSDGMPIYLTLTK